MENQIIKVQNVDITVSIINDDDYIYITYFAIFCNKDSRAADVIRNWLRTRSTLEFLSTWETLYNKDFKVFESEHFRKQVGLLTFTPSVSQWISETNAKGLYVKKGKYGGTYAHKDITFEFASAINSIFKLYLLKEFDRMKTFEKRGLNWNFKRELTKINHDIHIDAIRNNLIPDELTRQQINEIYALETDVINMALFNMTADKWHKENPDKGGNMRDYANAAELVCLVNLENLNAHFIEEGYSQTTRIKKLNEIAIHQMRLLTSDNRIRKLNDISKTEKYQDKQ